MGRDLDVEIDRTAAGDEGNHGRPRPLVGAGLGPGLWHPRALNKSYPEGWVVLIDRLPETISALAIVVDDEMERVLGAHPRKRALSCFRPQMAMLPKSRARSARCVVARRE